MPDRVLAVKSTVAISASHDRVTLLDLDHLDRTPIILEDSAAAIWNAIDGVRTDEAIVDELADRYAVDREVLHDDVIGLLDDLLARELVVRR